MIYWFLINGITNDAYLFVRIISIDQCSIVGSWILLTCT